MTSAARRHGLRRTGTAASLVRLGQQLSEECSRLRFGSPVTHVYNPLDYARPVYQAYLERYADGPRKVLFLGMNPGPFGMAQTGVPFGEVAMVRDWLGLAGEVGRPAHECPKRPVLGFECPRSEVSGKRLWGLFRQAFKEAERFFADHLVLNYCPLLFLDASAGKCRNLTPDKLPANERGQLQECCDRHLRAALETLKVETAVGVGKFAEARLKECLGFASDVRVVSMPHPSPANPAANGDYGRLVRQALGEGGIRI